MKASRAAVVGLVIVGALTAASAALAGTPGHWSRVTTKLTIGRPGSVQVRPHPDFLVAPYRAWRITLSLPGEVLGWAQLDRRLGSELRRC